MNIEERSAGRSAGARGRARALTVVAPVPRRYVPVLRLALGIKRRLGPDPALQRMSFIHSAHWVLLEHLPGESRPTRYAYLLFASNFNGSWRDYIDAFAIAVPRRMTILWGGSYGFPGPHPPTPFVNYIERNQLAPAHYYSAYPDASATEVASALRVRDRLRHELLPALSQGDQRVAAAWRRFLTHVQRDL
jgi:hypothetical protein